MTDLSMGFVLIVMLLLLMHMMLSHCPRGKTMAHSASMSCDIVISESISLCTNGPKHAMYNTSFTFHTCPARNAENSTNHRS